MVLSDASKIYPLEEQNTVQMLCNAGSWCPQLDPKLMWFQNLHVTGSQIYVHYTHIWIM